LWRYAEALLVNLNEPRLAALSMGEGFTPLVAERIGSFDIAMKVEFVSPTLSFKDRGAVVLVAHALQLGVNHVVADSSGNAGTAISAYAARAGIRCTVFVPEATSPNKLAQMTAHGADVTVVPGSREDAAAAAIEAVESSGAFYASHVYNPFFTEGIKTYGYEICEQLSWTAPDTLVIPVGNGTMLLGAHLAFMELKAAGIIDRTPRIIAVQAAACAPIAEAFSTGTQSIVPVRNTGTLAEGIAIAEPARGTQLLEIVRGNGGVFVTVDDDEILKAQWLLARRGWYVEHTAAVPLAGALKAHASGTELGRSVLPLSGAGLKSA
jgi:threonine synthase